MTNQNDEDGLLLKIKRVAQRLGQSERQVYNLIDRDELEAVHEGRSVFVTASSERAYVERLRQRAAERRAARAAEAKSRETLKATAET